LRPVRPLGQLTDCRLELGGQTRKGAERLAEFLGAYLGKAVNGTDLTQTTSITIIADQQFVPVRQLN
jgi:hypothetical protein